MKLRTEALSWQRLEADAVLLDLRTSTYFTVNSTGADLVDALATGERTEADLQQVLLVDYDVTPERAAADVRALLADLDGQGLLERPA